MLINFILFLIVMALIFLLVYQIRKPNIYHYVKPECRFIISKPQFEINDNVRVAKYSVISKNKNRYFLDFPVAFKFYSTEKFRSKIRITYSIPGDDDIELIYDNLLEYDDNVKEHIYYINDIIIGAINIEVYTFTDYGKPTISFEILTNELCKLSEPKKLEINFPE